MADETYPMERLIPEGNIVKCDPCADGLATWWPSLQAGLDHTSAAHSDSDDPPTLFVLSPVIEPRRG